MRGGVTRSALLIVLLVVPVSLAAQPKLVNEKLVFEEEDPVHVGLQSMLLSPDGRHLLYLRREQVDVAGEPGRASGSRRAYRLAVRDLVSGRDLVVPVPAFPDSDPTDPIMKSQSFGPGGKQVVFGAGVDANGDGFFDYPKETMQIVLYDVASGTVSPLGVTGGWAAAMFDRTGEGLLITTADPADWSIQVQKTPLARLDCRPVSVDGVPYSICPAADVAAVVLQLAPPPKRYKKQKLVLYDLQADRQLLELPTHVDYSQVGRRRAEWTADGRFLYYTDLGSEDDPPGGEESRDKTVTRVWDRLEGKGVGLMRECLPIGPGPTATSMLLTEATVRGDLSSLHLHDAAEGRIWEFGQLFDVMICAHGRRVVYGKEVEPAHYAVYMAEIAIPSEDE